MIVYPTMMEDVNSNLCPVQFNLPSIKQIAGSELPFQIPDIHFQAYQYADHCLDESFLPRWPIFSHQLASASLKRKVEYWLGRQCTAQALFQLGYPPECITSNPIDRAPIWPQGIVGSITHTQHWVMSAITQHPRFFSLGIDSERLRPDTTKMFRLISKRSTPQEQQIRSHYPFSIAEWFYLLFSAKESLFKCLYPLHKKFFGPFDSEIIKVLPHTQSYEKGEFQLCLKQPLGHLPSGHLLTGFYHFHAQAIHTCLVLTRSEAPCNDQSA